MAGNPNDQIIVINPTSEEFTVKWSGAPHTLQSGQKLIMPRFLGEHFAKRLADKILLQMEEKDHVDYIAKGGHETDYKPKSYLNSKTERPKVIKQIILGVYSYMNPTRTGDAGLQLQQQVQAMNPTQPQEKPIDLGDEVDPLLGVLKDDKPAASEAITAMAAPMASPPPPIGMTPDATPTESGVQKRARLFKEAQQLDIPVSNKMSVADLEQAIINAHG